MKSKKKPPEEVIRISAAPAKTRRLIEQIAAKEGFVCVERTPEGEARVLKVNPQNEASQ